MIKNAQRQFLLQLPGLLSVMVALILYFPIQAAAVDARIAPVVVGADASGNQRTGQRQIWHDPSGEAGLSEARTALREGNFGPLNSAGSTGLQPGSFWSYFVLENPTSLPLKLNLEYVDHQLIGLAAYARPIDSLEPFALRAQLEMGASFDQRPVFHNRFVVPVTVPAGKKLEVLVQMDSEEAGFVFPSMRIWTPENLSKAHTMETAILSFLFGGIVLIAVFSLIVGITVRDPSFLAYSVYGIAKIIAWATILGFTHQYLLKESFHWSYMSAAGALGILCGVVFDRMFLETRRYTPKLDHILVLMIVNALILMLSALLQVKAIALISITLALLLYPASVVIAMVRWRQGSSEAAVFAIGWTVLLSGLFFQALRDIGLIEHNMLNYYLPPLSSFVEMVTVMAAMGLKLRRLRLQGKAHELRYREHLEESKMKLEGLVLARTEELEKAKQRAELEARTDPLTGTRNRRSFIADAELCIKRAHRKSEAFSLLMFDIDHFKAINDNHGHGVGDEALRQFCLTIQKKIRETDIFGRLGGEEFALLIVEDPADALHTAERLRDNIAGIRVHTPDGALQFTSSIGIAHGEIGKRTDPIDIESLLRQADRALYRAKAQGRDMVVAYSEDISAGLESAEPEPV